MLGYGGDVYIEEIDTSFNNLSVDSSADCMFKSKVSQDKNKLSYVDTKKISGVDFYHYINYQSMDIYLKYYCPQSGCGYYDIYRTFYNGKCYELTSERLDEKVPDIFNQIIATFKFTK